MLKDLGLFVTITFHLLPCLYSDFDLDEKESSSHVKTVLPDNLTLDLDTKTPKLKDVEDGGDLDSLAEHALLLHCKSQCAAMKPSRQAACESYCEELATE